jgi:hypothetical protein
LSTAPSGASLICIVAFISISHGCGATDSHVSPTLYILIAKMLTERFGQY